MNTIFLLIQVAWAMQACSYEKPRNTIEATGYSIVVNNNTNREMGMYLFEQLKERCTTKGVVLLDKREDNYKQIKIEVNSTLTDEYCINCTPDVLTLKARSKKTAKWLMFQFIGRLAETDQRIRANDLPPAIIPFKPGCYNFDFVYREPYFCPNPNEAVVLGTHLLEEDWGIWGHNINKILVADNKNTIFAKVDGAINWEQYCFSSEETFRQIKEYILNNYGNSKNHQQQFMIMPTDNKVACNCDKCVSAGNTPNNATPAVSQLIKRLTTLFPYHTFFTTAYLSTQNPPHEQWPANTGVMISTIDLPKGIILDEKSHAVKRFLELTKQWKETTKNIYIWDYASNFDDYLTPIPVLYSLQKQLSFYKKQGVKGVFLNAGGYDYSPFNDVKSYVAAALMMDCTLLVDSLCRAYFSCFYPMSGQVLADYYLALEKKQQQLNKPYHMYAGFEEALNSYLDPNTFMSLYKYLEKHKDKAENDEKDKLNKLFVALSFTRLQIAYYQVTKPYGFADKTGRQLTIKPETKRIFEFLAKHKEYDVHNYKEAYGKVESYLNNWRRMFMKPHFQNLLMGESITALSKLDEQYQKLEMLNDGVTGFEVDYHQGWFINSANYLELQFDTRNIKSTRQITLRFLVDERHHIEAPVKMEIYKNNKLYTTITPQCKSYHILPNSVEISEKISLADANVVSIKIFRKPTSKSFACDEIQLEN